MERSRIHELDLESRFMRPRSIKPTKDRDARPRAIQRVAAAHVHRMTYGSCLGQIYALVSRTHYLNHN